jgi:hypothetical protein
MKLNIVLVVMSLTPCDKIRLVNLELQMLNTENYNMSLINAIQNLSELLMHHFTVHNCVPPFNKFHTLMEPLVYLCTLLLWTDTS